MLKGIIFDFDGTLADSEPAQAKARDNLTARYFGKPAVVTGNWVGVSLYKSYAKIWNTDDKELAKRLVCEHFEEIIKLMKNGEISATPGALELMKYLKQKGIKIGVASGSMRYYVEEGLKCFNFMQYVDAFSGGDEVENSKPMPDVYELTLKRLGLGAKDVIACEDSSSGYSSATAAGIKCVVYNNDKIGELHISSMEELKKYFD